jgi:hypothetical protein
MNGTKDGRTVTWMVFIVIFISFRNSTWLLVAIDSDRKVSSVHLSVHKTYSVTFFLSSGTSVTSANGGGGRKSEDK